MDFLKVNPTPDEFMRMCAAAFFAVVILGALLSIVGNRVHRSYRRWRKQTVPRNVFGERVRLAGGFATLLFSVVINNGFVSVAAVFIGGLLIAPARFLLVLAATLRSDGKHAADIALGVIKMKPGEINDKLGEDAEDADDEDDQDKKPPRNTGSSSTIDGPGSRPPAPRSHSEIINKVKQIEESLFSILREQSRYQIEPYSIVKYAHRTFQYDAVMIDEDTGEIRTAIEIKYRRHMSPSGVSEVLNRIKLLESDKYSLLLVMVFDSYTDKNLKATLKLRENILRTQQNIGISLYIFKDNSLRPINDDDLHRLV